MRRDPLVTDGLKAEREQSITIDVAYRYFSTPRRDFIVADTPGHEQYTRNMATGASTANVSVILVDARHGVTVQSKRHAFISSLLGVSHMLVAVNKMDLVGYSEDAFDQISSEFSAFAAKLEVRDISFVPISALRGDNVVERSPSTRWYQGKPLLNHLETLHIASDRNLVDLRFPVQYVLRPNQGFRGYCGSVASGILREGDEVLSLPSSRLTRVKSITTFDGELVEAFPPQPATVLLSDDVDLSRGDMLVHPNNLPDCTESVDAMLVWMSEHRGQIGDSYLVKHTTRIVPGVMRSLLYKINVDSLHREPANHLTLNEIGRAELELRRPLFLDTYAKNRTTGSFILIDRMTNATVAAGVIVDRKPGSKPSSVARSSVKKLDVNLMQRSHTTGADRENLLGQRGAVVWLTGLSGSGKTTLAHALEHRLIGSGRLAYVLDGDRIRHRLCADLGYSPADRSENIRRAGEVAAILVEAGVITLAAFISPYRVDRERVRLTMPEGRFLEVFLDVPLEICESRDPKGLYRKARAGEIPSFTGIDAPYEPPLSPDLTLATHILTVDESVDRIEALLRSRNIIGV